MLFGCRLSLATVCSGVIVRLSELLPSVGADVTGTLVVVVVLVVDSKSVVVATVVVELVSVFWAQLETDTTRARPTTDRNMAMKRVLLDPRKTPTTV